MFYLCFWCLVMDGKKSNIFPYLTAQRLEVLTDIGVHHAVQMQVAALPESDQLKLLCLEISQYQFFALQTLLGNLRIKTVSCIFLQSWSILCLFGPSPRQRCFHYMWAPAQYESCLANDKSQRKKNILHCCVQTQLCVGSESFCLHESAEISMHIWRRPVPMPEAAAAEDGESSMACWKLKRFQSLNQCHGLISRSVSTFRVPLCFLQCRPHCQVIASQCLAYHLGFIQYHDSLNFN